MGQVASVSTTDRPERAQTQDTTRAAPTRRLSQAQLNGNERARNAARALGYGGIVDQILDQVVIPSQLRNAETMYRDARQTPGGPPVNLPRTQNDGTNRSINQLAYRDERLGSSSIARSGCLLSSMTMAANRLNGRSNTVVQARDTMQSRGAISGNGAMNVQAGAQALGLRQLSRRRANDSSMADATAELQRGDRALVVGVNYKANTRGEQSAVASGVDHYIMIHRANPDGSLSGVDPAGGVDLTFRRGADGVYRAQVGNKNYDIRDVGVYAGTAGTPSVTIPRRG